MAVDYKTISAAACDQFTEKRSRFIGYISPVTTEEQAMEFIAGKRQQHWDAAHNVFAYILRDGNIARFSDDGEPSGTAGKPVLDVLSGSGIVDAVIVVTRYFGGVLLGTGGLTRAYSQGARVAIEAAEVLNMCYCAEIEMELEYHLYGTMTHLLPKYGAEIIDSDFSAAVRMKYLVREADVKALLNEIEDATSAVVVPRINRWLFHNMQQR